MTCWGIFTHNDREQSEINGCVGGNCGEQLPVNAGVRSIIAEEMLLTNTKEILAFSGKIPGFPMIPKQLFKLNISLWLKIVFGTSLF